jgi:hypothetical protein
MGYLVIEIEKSSYENFFSKHHILLNPLTGTFFSGLFRKDGLGVNLNDGKIFIDRDPDLFRPILQFLRTRRISLPKDVDVESLIHEVEFFGVTEMISRLKICSRLRKNLKRIKLYLEKWCVISK